MGYIKIYQVALIKLVLITFNSLDIILKKNLLVLMAILISLLAAMPVAAFDATIPSAITNTANYSLDEYADEYADEYGDYNDSEIVADPLRGFNMMMYDFNRDVYYIAIKPATDVYRFVVPEDIRVCVGNFFQNLGFPIRLANCLLQGNVDRAVDEFEAFFLNTTVGVLGLGNPAPYVMGREVPAEDFGQTLAVWGIGNGFYLVLPILGPTTARNAVGSLGDFAMNPITYSGLPWEVTAIARGTEAINLFSFQKDIYKQLEEISLDPYIALRNGYIQNNNRKIAE